MNAGNIEITVSANYTQLQTALQQSVQTSTQAGQQAGQGFGENFERGQTRYIDRALQDIQGKLKKAFGAVAIGQALAGTLERAAEGAGWGESIVQSIKSTPIVGIAATIIESSFKLGFGNFEAEQKLKRSQERLAESEEQLKIALENDKKRSDRIAQSERDRQDAAFRHGLERAQMSGDKIAVIELEQQRDKAMAWRTFQEKTAEAMSKQEKDNLQVLYDTEIYYINLRASHARDLELKNRQEIADKQLKDDQERVRKVAESTAKEEAKASEERFKADMDAVNALQERLQKADEMRADAAAKAEDDRLAFARSTGSVSTSFGQFNFRGYTDNDKKQVDESILSQVREINKKASDFVANGIS